MSATSAPMLAPVAFVTGGSRGIGSAIAESLSRAGYTVVSGSRSSETALGSTGGTVRLDVSSAESIDAAVSAIEENCGPISVLVANAGVTKDTLLLRMSDDDIDHVINTNLNGSIRLARRVVRNMIKARQGRIIFVSSVVGLLGSAGQVNYSASKAGLIGAARSLTREVASRGITVNVIAPGFISTDMTDVLEDSVKADILQTIPSQRFGTTLDVAQLVTFLASDSAGYITGAVIPIDGGLGMGH